MLLTLSSAVLPTLEVCVTCAPLCPMDRIDWRHGLCAMRGASLSPGAVFGTLLIPPLYGLLLECISLVCLPLQLEGTEGMAAAAAMPAGMGEGLCLLSLLTAQNHKRQLCDHHVDMVGNASRLGMNHTV